MEAAVLHGPWKGQTRCFCTVYYCRALSSLLLHKSQYVSALCALRCVILPRDQDTLTYLNECGNDCFSSNIVIQMTLHTGKTCYIIFKYMHTTTTYMSIFLGRGFLTQES